MNPQQGGSNPFIDALMKMRSGGNQQTAGGPQNAMLQRAVQPASQGEGGPMGMSQAIQQGANMGPGAGAQGQGQGMQQPTIESATVPGQNPGSTASLVKALSAMNGVITDSSDPKEIALARKVITLLQEMVRMDQERQGSQDSIITQAQQGAANFPPQHLQAPMAGPGQVGQ